MWLKGEDMAMGDTIEVILSTYGGTLGKQAKIALVEQAMSTVGLEYHLQTTQYAGHAIELARQATQEKRPIIVAAGGDGTINEVLNGIMPAVAEEQHITLGIIPLGTANDLADVLGLPRDVTAACQRIAAGATRLIDVALVNGRYFVNNSGVGLEPVISLEHEQMRRVKGNLRYILAALKGIIKAKPWRMRLAWDDGDYEGPIILVSIGNSPRTGGAFYMTPKALLDDGLLDFVYAVGMSRWQLLRLLPKTFTGQHINHPLVHYVQTTSLSITASPSTPIQADGEVIDRAALEITYRILPKKLRVII
jgi:diacylglycerol kinase (ATP)